MRIVVLSFLALAGFSAAGAQETQAPAPAEAPKEKKICRSEPQLGSIMNKRTCHTRAEWASIDAANRVNVERIQNQSNNSAPRN